MSEPIDRAPGADDRPPPPPAYRWAVLVVISFAMFGNYYVYDAVSPVADLLKEQLKFTDSDIGTLNAIYSLPNVIMVLVGGIIIDQVGVRLATILFGILCFGGACLTASTGTLTVMAGGRLLFGLGAESLIVAVTTALARWFRGKELSFAFGVNLTLARLGSFLALTSPTWAKRAFSSWQWPLVIAAAVGSLCIVAPIAYGFMDVVAVRRYRTGRAGGADKVAVTQLFKLSASFWLVVFLCATFYSAVFPFQTFAIKFFQEAHGTTREYAGFLSGLLPAFAMVITPLFGYVVDRVGRRSLFMMLGSLLLVPVYVLMAYTKLPLVVPMAMMGIAFSCIPAIMWPSVAYIVPQERLGTAYGLMTMIQNIGLAGFNFLIGSANDFAKASAENPGGYTLGMWIFSGLGYLGFLSAYLLRRVESGPKAHGLETITVRSSRAE
jgi:MFS family permease